MKKLNYLFPILKAAAFSLFGLAACLSPLQSGAQCTSTLFLALGNGSDGEGIAFNPNDGLIYHTSGISDGTEFFETVDPNTLTVGPNLEPGNTYGPAAAQEISGLAWYPPLNAFIVMDRDEKIFTVTTAGVFTQISTLASGSYLRGFAVAGANIYGVDPFSDQLVRFDPNTGAVLSSVALTESGNPTTGATALATQPISGIVYIVFKVGPQRHVGTVNVTTGVITDLGDAALNIAGITFNNVGVMYAVTGNGASPSETMFSSFSCVVLPILAVNGPTMSEWGLILLCLLTLTLGAVTVMRRQTALAGGGNASVSLGSLPFDRTLFSKMLGFVLPGFVVAFAVAVFVFGYEMTSADVPGSLLTAPVLAYLIHLLAGKPERS